MSFFAQLYDADDPKRRDAKRNVRRIIVGFSLWLALSSVCVALYALAARYQGSTASWSRFLNVLSSSALIGAAFISIGALLGFIFEIPRSPKSPSPTPAPSTIPTNSWGPGNPAMPPEDNDRFTPNTNLEDISDWLTKILVGAGLAQLAVLPERLERLANFFQTPLTPEVALLLIINFFVLGFMGSYLLTRLFLTEALRAVDGFRAGSLAATRVAQDLLLEIPPSASKEERDAKYEAHIYACLYLDPPEGFERAIKACLEYLQVAGDAPSPRILAYQAMAYGQKYDWEQKRGATKESLASLRNSALAAAQRAVASEPKLRQLLRTVWDPNDPTKLAGEENDLEVFFSDPDFKKLLDPPPA